LGYPEAVNRRRTDNTMAKIKGTAQIFLNVHNFIVFLTR
jgi:hypothetical protein